MPDPQPSPAITPLSLRAAVSKLLTEQAAAIPDRHGFAAIVNEHGAEVALASRLGDSWDIDAHGGYNWTDATEPGWHGELRVGRTW